MSKTRGISEKIESATMQWTMDKELDWVQSR